MELILISHYLSVESASFCLLYNAQNLPSISSISVCIIIKNPLEISLQKMQCYPFIHPMPFIIAHIWYLLSYQSC